MKNPFILLQRFRHLPMLSMLLLSAPVHADDLLEIFTLAERQDPQVAEARSRYEADHTQLTQSRANYLPRLSLNGRSARQANAPREIYSHEAGFNAHSWGVSLEQNILNLQAWYGWQAAKSGDQRALATLMQAEQDLIMRVTRAYFDVLRSVDALAAFTAEMEAAEAVLNQTQQRYDVGLAAITDVHEAQASSDLARVNHLREQRTLNQRQLVLEAITGRQHGLLEGLREAFPIQSIQPATIEEWVSLAAQNSPAIRVAEFDYEARRDEARAAKGAMLPTLSMSASFNDSAAAQNPFSFFPGIANRSSMIQLNLNVPLYMGGANSARMRQAYHVRDASEQALVRTKRENERNTRDSFIGVETDVLAVQARAQAIVSTRAALEAVEAGLLVGTRNTVDVVLAQRTLYQALREYANARYDYVIDTLQLKLAAGVLTPEDIVSLNEWLD